MSQENAELVRGLIGGTDAQDLIPLVRDDRLWGVAAEGAASVLHPDFEIVGTVVGTERAFVGVEGLREFLVDWLAPWDEYRSEVERTVDLGERVVTIFRIFGRREGSVHEVSGAAAWVWTIREGKVLRLVGYANPAEALKAVGLEE